MGMGGVNGVFNVLKITKWPNKERKIENKQKIYFKNKQYQLNQKISWVFCIY